MALITCPECGNQISDSANACPNCGFPMKEYISYINNEKKKNQDEEKRIAIEKEKERQRIAEEKNIMNTKCYECGKIIGNIDTCPYCGFDMVAYKKKKEIEEKRIIEIHYQQNLVSNKPENNTPQCPKCGSTAITAGQKGYSLLTGFLGSNKTVNRCANCGHMWKPGR